MRMTDDTFPPSREEQAFSEDLQAAASTIGSAVERLLGSWEDNPTVPPTIFHFTDTGGLIGVLSSKTLRASLATALNDASETKYAISRFRSNLTSNAISLKNLKRDKLLEQSGEGTFRVDFRTYVVSFCAAAEIVHWLHYGRSGTGVALEFESLGLFAVNQFTLNRVIYETPEQDRFLAAILECIDDLVPQIASTNQRLDPFKNPLMDSFFAEVAVSLLRFAAPRMKDPAFRSENEWRLLSNEVWRPGTAATPTRKTHFRTTNGRIVPYKEVDFEELPLRRIVIGASAPMDVEEQALAVLMEDALERRVPVTRSTVMVRP